MRLQILNDKSGPIALWAFWALCVLGAAIFWLVVFSGAADAQTVGPTCTLLWNAPTTNADGTPLTTPILEYWVYVRKAPTPAPVIGTDLPTAKVTAPALLWNCVPAGAGQNYVWVTAFNGRESAVQASPLAFVLVLTPPATPGNLRVTP